MFNCDRVERSVEAEVPETTSDGGQERQPCQHHGLLVPGSCHWCWQHASSAEDQGRFATAVPRANDATPRLRTPAGFHPAVSCHQGRVASPVAGWAYWQRVSDRSTTTAGHQWTDRLCKYVLQWNIITHDHVVQRGITARSVCLYVWLYTW